MSTFDTLDVYVHGQPAGRLVRRHDAHVDFVYDTGYLDDNTMPPLSLSLPKHTREHRGDAAGRWISNLLPDSELRRERMAAMVGLRRATAFDLLGHVGFDAAGAVQIVAPGAAPSEAGSCERVTDAQIADQLRALRRDPDHVVHTFGRWSLAGQHGKIAVARDDDAWHAPTGRSPSTHIIKMGIHGFADSDIAEFVTMRAANHLGIDAAAVELRDFDGVTGVVITRFDRRLEPDGTVARIHQEDLCQALGVAASVKYESDGGPGLSTISTVLAGLPVRTRAVSLHRFATIAAFNALTFAPDAHAKNYALLHAGSATTLAPAYDLTSAALVLPPKEVLRRTSLAMKFGSSRYEADGVQERHIARAAQALRVDSQWLEGVVARMAGRMGEAFHRSIDQAESSLGGINLDAMRSRIDPIIARTERVFAGLGSASMPPPGSDQAPILGPIEVPPHTRSGRPVQGHVRRRSHRTEHE